MKRLCPSLRSVIIFFILVWSIVRLLLYSSSHLFVGKDFFKLVNESVRHIHTSRNLFRTGHHPISKKGPPFVLENQTRYIGEDAKFTCRDQFNGSVSQVHQILWLKNNEAVVNGSNRYITWGVVTDSENKVTVTTNLTILSATEDDFGMYQCFVVILKSDFPKHEEKPKPKPKRQAGSSPCVCVCDNVPTPRQPEFTKEDIADLYYKMHKKHWIGEFHLLREKPRNRTLFVVPGTLISLAVFFRHLRNVDNFSVSFTRSGRDIQTFDVECSYSSQISAFLLRLAGAAVVYNNVTYIDITAGLVWKARVGVIWSCISPSMYGVYQITILRKVYNKTNGSMVIEKLEYPIKVYIKPKESSVITENVSNNKNRGLVLYNESCWSEEELSPESCKYIKSLVVSVFDNRILYEESIQWKLLILLCVAILISVIVQFFMAPYCWYKSIQLYYRIKKPAGDKCLAGIQINPDLQYHLYISSVSNDRAFIDQNILTILAPLDLNVFDEQQDIPAGRGLITEISNAINKSRKCLVIACKKYMESSIHNMFEMLCILTKYSNCDLMVINVDNCPIHEMFKDNYTVINCSSDGFSNQSKTELIQWAVQDRDMIPCGFSNSFLTTVKSIFLCINRRFSKTCWDLYIGGHDISQLKCFVFFLFTCTIFLLRFWGIYSIPGMELITFLSGHI